MRAAYFVPICSITTPPLSSLRYETWFLRCEIPPGSKLEIWPGELEGGFFVRAEEALDRWRRGEVLVAPPVLTILQELRGRSCRTFLTPVLDLTDSYARGELHRIYFSCGVLLVLLKTPTHPPATHTNAYLVGEARLYLVDPGCTDSEEQEKLWTLLDALLQEGRRLEGILLTRHHPDHTGAASACSRRYRLPVYAHPMTAACLPEIEFHGHLRHGQSLDLGSAPDGTAGWKLAVYHLPGHAPGHLVFQETRYGALLAGDLVSTLSPILIDPGDGDLAEYIRSLELLDSLAGEGTLYPGHGQPVTDGRKLIRQAIRHRREREEKLIAALDRLQPRPLAFIERYRERR